MEANICSNARFTDATLHDLAIAGNFAYLHLSVAFIQILKVTLLCRAVVGWCLGVERGGMYAGTGAAN